MARIDETGSLRGIFNTERGCSVLGLYEVGDVEERGRMGSVMETASSMTVVGCERDRTAECSTDGAQLVRKIFPAAR